MCVLALGFRVPGLPALVLAANRDEFYDRPATPPALLPGAPRIVAGLDGRAGGTWLGLNEHGVIAALTNRRTTAPAPEPALPTSRGRLCLEALRHSRAESAAAWAAAAARRERYNPCSLVVAGPDGAWFLTDDATPVPLAPGWHVLANAGLDDPADPRVARAAERLRDLQTNTADELLCALRSLCADHGAGGDPAAADALCVHRERAGTRSASIILVPAAGAPTCLHADGTPCATPFRAVAIPWATPAR